MFSFHGKTFSFIDTTFTYCAYTVSGLSQLWSIPAPKANGVSCYGAPAGFKLACSSSNAAVTIPSSFTFPTGYASAEVPITSTTVTAQTAVTITIGGVSFTLTVYP